MNRVGCKRKSRGERVLEGCEGPEPRLSKPLRNLPTLGCSSPPTPDKHPKKLRVTHLPGRDEMENEVHTGLEYDVAPSIVADRPVGMLNGGNYCYMAASLQAILTPSFVKKLTEVGEDGQFMQNLPEAGVVRTLLGVARRFDAERGQLGGNWVTEIADVHALVQARFPSLRGSRQQDAAEFYTLLLEGLMEEMVAAESGSFENGDVPLSKSRCPASQTFLLSFLGKRVGTCESLSQVKHSRWFMEFAVSEESKDLAWELSKQFQEEEEISTFCETCDSSHKVKETLGLNRVPEFFVVHANRNQDTQKCQAPLMVPQKLVVENGQVAVKSYVGTQESQTAPVKQESILDKKTQPCEEEKSEGDASKLQVTPPRRAACSSHRSEEGSGSRSVGTSRGALVGGDAEEFSTPVRSQKNEEFSTPVRSQRNEEFSTPVAQIKRDDEFSTPVAQTQRVLGTPTRDNEALFGMPQNLLEEEEQLQRAMQESLRDSGANVAVEDEEDELLQRALRESLAESQQLEALSQEVENKGGNREEVKNEPEPTPFVIKGQLVDDTVPEGPVGSTFNLVGYVTHHGGTVLSGHYTARIKTSSGAWWWCNDENVVGEAADEALGNAENGSLFFYQRENPVDSQNE